MVNGMRALDLAINFNNEPEVLTLKSTLWHLLLMINH